MMLAAMIAALLAATMTSAYAQAAEAQVTPSAAYPGEVITITGSGFQPTETVTVMFGGGTVASAVVNGKGLFELSGAVPAKTPEGLHTIDVFGSLGSYAQAQYQVLAMAPAPSKTLDPVLVSTPAFVASPPAAMAGDVVTISGTAFIPGELVEVMFGGEVIATATAGKDGSFVTKGLIASDMLAGPHPLDVIGSEGSTVTIEYEVLGSGTTPGQTPAPIGVSTPGSGTTSGQTPAPIGVSTPFFAGSPASAEPGDAVLISGSGFAAGELIEVVFGGEVIATAIAGDDGSFVTEGLIPAGMPAGSHPLDVYGSADTMLTIEYLVLASALTVVDTPTAPASGSDPGTTSTGPTTSNVDDDSDAPTSTTNTGPTTSNSGTSTSNSGSSTGTAGSDDSSANPE
ncbi:MAG: hypothetical protein IID15_00565, partial [Candidatus Marinimicrobia bacterium]|nr:hypothetical protein [Candidatus Neomarinimicrobiota bacterium]